MDLLEKLNYECWSVYNNEFVTQIQRLEKAKVKQSDIRSKLSPDKYIQFDNLCLQLNLEHLKIINKLKKLRDKHS